jgi:hypothetical protein
MKIYSVFNSRNELLANFGNLQELYRYIRRHSRCSADTKIFQTNLDSWNEFDYVLDVTKQHCLEAYNSAYSK